MSVNYRQSCAKPLNLKDVRGNPTSCQAEPPAVATFCEAGKYS